MIYGFWDLGSPTGVILHTFMYLCFVISAIILNCYAEK